MRKAGLLTHVLLCAFVALAAPASAQLLLGIGSPETSEALPGETITVSVPAEIPEPDRPRAPRLAIDGIWDIEDDGLDLYNNLTLAISHGHAGVGPRDPALTQLATSMGITRYKDRDHFSEVNATPVLQDDGSVTMQFGQFEYCNCVSVDYDVRSTGDPDVLIGRWVFNKGNDDETSGRSVWRRQPAMEIETLNYRLGGPDPAQHFVRNEIAYGTGSLRVKDEFGATTRFIEIRGTGMPGGHDFWYDSLDGAIQIDQGGWMCADGRHATFGNDWINCGNRQAIDDGVVGLRFRLRAPQGLPTGKTTLWLAGQPIPIIFGAEEPLASIRFLKWDEGELLTTTEIAEGDPFWIEAFFKSRPDVDRRTLTLHVGEREFGVPAARTEEDGNTFRSSAFVATGWDAPTVRLDNPTAEDVEDVAWNDAPASDPAKIASDWLHGGWDVAYRDSELGVVVGRADLSGARTEDRFKSTTAGSLRLVDPNTGNLMTLQLAGRSIEGGALVLDFDGASPPSGYRTGRADFDQAAANAMELDVGAGTILVASVDSTHRSAQIVDDAAPSFLRNITVRLEVPDAGEPAQLSGEWSYKLSRPGLMYHGRAGLYDPGSQTARNAEAWGRPAPRVVAVTDLGLPSRRELAEFHSEREGRVLPIWMRPETQAALEDLVREHSDDAYAKTWLRIDGIDLPVQPRRSVAVRFEDPLVTWTGRSRPNANDPRSLDVEVVLRKGVEPGTKKLWLNGSEGTWYYDMEPAQIRYVRLISAADPDEEIPAGYEFISDLYLGEIFAVEFVFPREPPFDTRRAASRAGGGPVIEYEVQKVDGRPNILRSPPLFVEALVGLDGLPSGPPPTGTSLIPAVAGTQMMTAEIEARAPAKGKMMGLVPIREYPGTLWEDAMARAQTCRDQGLSDTEVTNFFVAERMLNAAPAFAIYKEIVWGGQSPVTEFRRDLKIDLEDHAAAILLRDELRGSLQEFTTRERGSVTYRPGLQTEEERRKHAALSTRTATLISLARSQNRGMDAGLLQIDVELPEGLGDLDGATMTPLATALGNRMEADWFNGDREAFFTYAMKAAAEAIGVLASNAERSRYLAEEPGDCDVLELLALIRHPDISAALTQRVARKLMRPPLASEPRKPRARPDRQARAYVASTFMLAQAIKDQEDYASIDTDVAVTLATLPVAVVGGGVSAAARAGTNVRSLAQGVEAANWALDLADAGLMFRDLVAWSDADQTAEFAEGLVGIAGTRQLKEARAAARGAALGMAMTGGMLGIQGVAHGASSVRDALRSAKAKPPTGATAPVETLSGSGLNPAETQAAVTGVTNSEPSGRTETATVAPSGQSANDLKTALNDTVLEPTTGSGVQDPSAFETTILSPQTQTRPDVDTTLDETVIEAPPSGATRDEPATTVIEQPPNGAPREPATPNSEWTGFGERLGPDFETALDDTIGPVTSSDGTNGVSSPDRSWIGFDERMGPEFQRALDDPTVSGNSAPAGNASPDTVAPPSGADLVTGGSSVVAGRSDRNISDELTVGGDIPAGASDVIQQNNGNSASPAGPQPEPVPLLPFERPSQTRAEHLEIAETSPFARPFFDPVSVESPDGKVVFGEMSPSPKRGLQRNVFDEGSFIALDGGENIRIGSPIASGRSADVFRTPASKDEIVKAQRIRSPEEADLNVLSGVDVDSIERGIAGRNILEANQETNGYFTVVEQTVAPKVITDQEGNTWVVSRERSMLDEVNGQVVSNASDRFELQPPNAAQRETMVLAVREMNRKGIAWTDHKGLNFDIRPDGNSPTGYKMVVLDTGGVYGMIGRTEWERFENARRVQSAADNTQRGSSQQQVFKFFRNSRFEEVVDRRPFRLADDANPRVELSPGANANRTEYLNSFNMRPQDYDARLTQLDGELALPPILDPRGETAIIVPPN